MCLHSDNTKFEIGANWIHGILGNPIYEIALDNGLVDIVGCTKPHRVVAATDNGKQIPFVVLQVLGIHFNKDRIIAKIVT